MIRKILVRTSALAMFFTVGWLAYTQTPAQPPALTMDKLKDNMYEIIGDGGNVIVYITTEGVIMVDDKYGRDFENVMAKVKSVTSLPVKYIFSTHYHEDHSGGNTLFAPTTDIISTANARRGIVEKKQSNASPGMTGARITFTSETSVWLGGREVRAHHYGRGHTDGDAVIYFPAEKLIHTGDLMSGNTPLIDYPGGGSLKDWADTLDGALGIDFETVVPGHGPVTNRAGLTTYRNNVEKEKYRAQGLIREGKSADELAKVMQAEFFWTPQSLQMQWSLPGMMTELK